MDKEIICLKRLKELVKVHRFIVPNQNTVPGIGEIIHCYGTPGTLFRRNILREWWKYMVSLQENTFPVEPTTSKPISAEISTHAMEEQPTNTDIISSPLSKDLLSNFPHTLELVNRRLPFSLAGVGTCYQNLSEKNKEESENRVLPRCESERHLVHHHYSPPGNVSQTFDHWLSYRLRWWRQFASKPSSFITKNRDMPNGKIRSSIEYKFPWGSETLETVTNYGDQAIQSLEDELGTNLQGKFGRKMVHPHIIECHTSVEPAMSAFLVDCFQHKTVFTTNKNTKNNTERTVLHLHSHLAPFNVAMVMTGSKSRELRQVTNHWSDELREAGLRVLDTADTNLTQETQFKRNDELGVLYTVILNDQTLDTGVISIRHRDTMLREQVHITRFKERLLRYTSPI